MSEYDPEEEKYKARMAHYGMHTKEPDDVTIEDCLSDLSQLLKIHKDSIKGVVVIPVYEHLDMQDLEKKMKNLDENDLNRIPTFSFLCSGGIPLMEVIGSIESAKIKMINP